MQRISVVALVDGDEANLGAFLTSLSARKTGMAKLEAVVVQRGSNGGAGTALNEWQRRHPTSFCRSPRSLSGVMAARNAGLALASAPWVMFCDSIRPLPSSFFEVVAACLADNQTGELALLCAGPPPDTVKRVRSAAPGGGTNGCLLGVDELDAVPDINFPCIFRRDLLLASDALLDSPVRPGFDEAVLRMRYLLHATGLSVGWVPESDSVAPGPVDHGGPGATVWTDKATYSEALEHGYLRPLEEAQRLMGRPPVWLQRTVLCDLQWYFTVDRRERAPTVAVTEPMAVAFHALVRRIMRAIDVNVVTSLSEATVGAEVRHALRSYQNSTGSSIVEFMSYDHCQDLVRLHYYIYGEPPNEQFLVDGESASPAYAKYRACRFFHRTLFQERIIWLASADANEVAVLLDGEPALLSPGSRSLESSRWELPARVASLASVRRAYPPGKGAQQEPLPWRLRGLKARLVQWLARQPLVRRKFADAWVFTDRETDADDNAEHLYRWVRQHYPDINAWFLLSPSSPQWQRLASEGFRLVPRGLRRKLLVLNSDHIVSSHTDYAFGDLDSRLYGRVMAWRYTFLQHGVAEKDLSHWLNDLPFDRVITSSPAEHAAIVDDGTPYTYTAREARRTGLPRHDRLLGLASKLLPSEVDTILVLPTWRAGLLKSTGRSRHGMQDEIQALRNSNYVGHWRSLLCCGELRDIALRHGKKVRFMPHPNLVPYIEAFDLPPHVEVVTKAGVSIQELFCRSSVMITDYSSVAFEMAYLRRPVIYYQFDREQFYSGGHNWREGYFNYERDGFGPVAFQQGEVITGLDSLLSGRAQPEKEYLARMERALPERDGGACRRVFESILELRQPFKSRLPVREGVIESGQKGLFHFGRDERVAFTPFSGE